MSCEIIPKTEQLGRVDGAMRDARYGKPHVRTPNASCRRFKTRQSPTLNPPVKGTIPASRPRLVLAGINRASGGFEPSSTPKSGGERLSDYRPKDEKVMTVT